MTNEKLFETMNLKTMRGNILVFDTETADSVDSPIPYDFSLLICDSNFNVIFKQCYLISEIWNDFDRYSKSFYGLAKKGIYNQMLRKGQAKVVSAKQFNKELKSLMVNNNVRVISAFNLRFDMKAYQKLCNENGLVNHLEKKTKLDIQLLTQERLRGSMDFINWCLKNNATTPKGYCSVKVDFVYKYLFKSKVNEKHIGISDIIQEMKILKKFITENPITIINEYQSFKYFLIDLKIDKFIKKGN